VINTEIVMKYVVYYRVSSKQQGQSGLGLEAQRTAVEAYLKTHKAEEIPPSFKEVVEKTSNQTPFRQSKRTIGSQNRLTPSFLTKTVKNFS
jgi:DNA invertase Pin-like site-specific DNA recombinase